MTEPSTPNYNIKQGAPSPSEGANGSTEVRWVSNGLFFFVKYQGKWYSRKLSDRALSLGEEISTTTIKMGNQSFDVMNTGRLYVSGIFGAGGVDVDDFTIPAGSIGYANLKSDANRFEIQDHNTGGIHIGLEGSDEYLTFLGTDNEVTAELGGTGNRTLTIGLPDDVTITGNLTVSGTTTTIDTTVTVSDAMVINNAGSDVGLKINSTSSGHMLQVQDNGTDILVVKDGGNVGIGTNAPKSTLDVKQSANDGRSGIRITRHDTAANAWLLANHGGNFVISLDDDNDGTDESEFMRIDGTGNVGIGTSSPASEGTGTILHIHDDSDNQAILNLSGGSGADNSAIGEIHFSDPDNTDEAFARIVGSADGTDGGQLGFWTQPTGAGTLAKRLAILEDGKVGIGTALPKTELHIDTPEGTTGLSLTRTQAAQITNSTALGVIYFGGVDDENTMDEGYDAATIQCFADGNWGATDRGTQLVFNTTIGVVTSPVMTIEKNGRVGIGTTGPDRTLDVLDTSNPQLRLTRTDGSVYVDFEAGSNTSGDLYINPDHETAHAIILRVENDVPPTYGTTIKTDGAQSGVKGWQIDYLGGMDMRYISVDEMHAKAFIADLEQALAGGQIISKSVAVLAEDFTCPDNDIAEDLVVEDLPSAGGMDVFQADDYVRLRTFDRSGGGLTIADCWGKVTAGATNSDGTQTWTFTRAPSGSGGAVSADTVIAARSLVLDYGTDGNGYYEVNAIDGVNAANSPYAQIVTWTDGAADTGPGTANAFTVNARLGNLKGVHPSGTTEYGLFAGDGSATTDSYLLLSESSAELHNLPLRLFKDSSETIKIEPGISSDQPYIAVGTSLIDGAWGAGDEGFLVKGSANDGAELYIGRQDGNYLQWVSDTLTVSGVIHVTAGGSYAGDSISSDNTEADVTDYSTNNTQNNLITGTTITGGGIILSGGGSIYTTGHTAAVHATKGFFLGHDGASDYDFGIGESGGQSLVWDGSAETLTVSGVIHIQSGGSYAGAEIGTDYTSADVTNYSTNNTTNQLEDGVAVTSGGVFMTGTAPKITMHASDGNVAYDQASAIFLGLVGGVPQFSMFGSGSDAYLSWNGSNLSIKGDITMNGGSIAWDSVSGSGTVPYDTSGSAAGVQTNLDATNTTVGTQGTYIDGSGIYTGTLSAGQINAVSATIESITSAQIDATYINALTIEADTVKSDWVYAGTLEADQVNAVEITADIITGATGTFSSSISVGSNFAVDGSTGVMSCTGASINGIDSNLLTSSKLTLTLPAGSTDHSGFRLVNDGEGYNQIIMENANPEIHMGYNGEGASPGSDISGSSKIFMNRANSDSHYGTIVFQRNGSSQFAIGNSYNEFVIASGGNIGTAANKHIRINSVGEIIILNNDSSGLGGGVRWTTDGSAHYWNQYVNNNGDLRFTPNDDTGEGGWLEQDAYVAQMTFTGQHYSFPVSGTVDDYIDRAGYIVSSSGLYNNMSSEHTTDRPSINETLPTVYLSSTVNDKKCFGVISACEDANETFRRHSAGRFVSSFSKEIGDDRLIINSLGEGAIWVSNYNGNLDNGDYITSSVIEGIGMKQADDLLHNYTVAKITQDCDFDMSSELYDCEEISYSGQTYKKAFVGCTYHCG